MSIKFSTKIPSLLGILITGCLVYIISLGSNSLFQNRTNASKSTSPENLQITNITDSSFSVTWTTNDPATGAVVISNTLKKPQTYFDERDSQGKMNSYVIHSVSIRELPPDNKYSFSIMSNGKSYRDKNHDFTISTAKTIAPPSAGLSLGPVYGSVRTPDDKAASGALVYISFDGSQMLSAVVSDSGSWIIPVHLIRTANMDSYFNIDKTIPLNITVRHISGEAKAVTNMTNVSPVPVMIIGKIYDFRMQAKTKIDSSETGSIAMEPTGTETGKSVLGEISDLIPVQKKEVAINQPVDKAALVSRQPLFSGTGIPGNKLKLTLSFLKPESVNLTVADDGVWRFTPPSPLGTGKQSVTISSADQDGKTVTVTRSFEILKSGTQVLGEATPSGTIAPTIIVPTLRPEPTEDASSSPTPIRTPTLNPSPTETSQSGELIAGNISPTIILLVISTLLILSGILIVI
jgi:hypothetical protein